MSSMFYLANTKSLISHFSDHLLSIRFTNFLHASRYSFLRPVITISSYSFCAVILDFAARAASYTLEWLL